MTLAPGSCQTIKSSLKRRILAATSEHGGGGGTAGGHPSLFAGDLAEDDGFEANLRINLTAAYWPTKAAVHWRRSVKRYVDPETQYEYLYAESSGESKWAAGTDWAVDPRLQNVARQIMARQKIVRAFQAKRSPIKAIKAMC